MEPHNKSSNIRSGVEDTTFEAEAKDLKKNPRQRTKKKIRGQGPTFRGQTLLRARIEMVEKKAKNQERNFSKLWSANFSSF